MSYLPKLSALLIICSLIQLGSGTPTTNGVDASGAEPNALDKVVNAASAVAGTAAETAKAGAEAAVETAKVGAEAAVETAKEGAEDAVKIAKEGAEAAVEVAKEGAVAAIETAKAVAGSVVDTVSGGANVVLSTGRQALTKISNTLDFEGKDKHLKGAKIILPFDHLIDETRECPRLQDMGAKLLNDKEFCDINIEVIDPKDNSKQLICAHKSILCMRSSVLSQKIRDLFKTHTGTERPTLELKGIEPRVFKWILSYMYLDKLPHEFKVKDNIMDLYLEALMLNMTDLLKLAEDHLYTSVTTKDAAHFLKWAHIHKLGKIKIFILDLVRSTLSMDKSEWLAFLKNLCEAYGYTLASGTAPLDIEAEVTKSAEGAPKKEYR